jgi:hypothetical protein
MKIKQSYTLECEEKNLLLRLNSNKLFCPFQENFCNCGDWCPAFQIIGGSILVKVKLNCFPQETIYEIEDY